MTLEQLVPTLEVCQQLKGAGFPQGTALAWYPEHCDDYDAEAPASLWPDEWKRIAVGQPVVCVREEMEDHESLCAAPTLSELLDVIRVKYPDAEVSLYNRKGVGIDADMVSDAASCSDSVGGYPTDIAALAVLVLEVVG